jgi:hypothetical protein
MQYRARVVLLVGCVGTAVGWFAHTFVATQEHHEASAVVDTSATAPIPGGPKGAKDSPKPDDVPKAAALAASDSATQTGRVPTGSSAPDLVARPVTDRNSSTSDGADQRTRHTPIEELHNSTSIECTFGPGNSAEWPDGKIWIGTSAWQGGPVDFGSIDINAGTAQMNGSGVTRMGSASIGVTVAPTNAGLNFSGIVGHGTLVVTTVFSGLDAAGHHIAVMSSHGLTGLETAQFYGTCDTH